MNKKGISSCQSIIWAANSTVAFVIRLMTGDRGDDPMIGQISVTQFSHYHVTHLVKEQEEDSRLR